MNAVIAANATNTSIATCLLTKITVLNKNNSYAHVQYVDQNLAA